MAIFSRSVGASRAQTSVARGMYKLSPGTDPDEPDLASCQLEWLSEKVV